MSHNIMLDKMFYGYREPAWHKLGIVTEEALTANEVLIKLGGGYWVEKRPLSFMLNGEHQESGDFALVRSAMPDDPREYNFGYVTKEYNVIQPLQIADVFDENVRVNVETMGFLGHGEKIFLTWALPKIEMDKNEEIKSYAFIAVGYDGKYGASLYNTYVRVVCQNTFNIAIQQAENAKDGKVWSGRHNSTNLQRDLGIWMEHVQNKAILKQQEDTVIFNQMNNYSFNSGKEVQDVIGLIYPDPDPIPVDWPIKLRASKEEKYEDDLYKSQRDRELVSRIFNGEGTAIDVTGWGLFNSVTEYENWGRATRKPAEYSIMLGNRNNTMNKAYKVIADHIKGN